MTDDNGTTDDCDRKESGIDRALAESQRLERDERNEQIARQIESDERIVRALTEE